MQSGQEATAKEIKRYQSVVEKNEKTLATLVDRLKDLDELKAFSEKVVSMVEADRESQEQITDELQAADKFREKVLLELASKPGQHQAFAEETLRNKGA